MELLKWELRKIWRPGILAAILLATCVGFAFEVSANKKFEILNQVNDDTMVQVIRGGNICELPRRDVVVGDIVILNTGEEVPAASCWKPFPSRSMNPH